MNQITLSLHTNLSWTTSAKGLLFLRCIFIGLIIVSPVAAEPIVTSELSPFNALVFGDFDAIVSDVEGNAAIGGNIQTVDYSFGFKLDPELAAATDVLTVQGELDLTRTRVYFGDLVHTGNRSLVQTGVDGTIRMPSTFDFADSQNHYTSLSQSLSQLATTGTATSEFNKLSLVGDPNLDVNVFVVTPDLWLDNNGNDVTVIDLDIANDSTAIINIAGTAPEVSFLGFDDVANGEPSPFRHQTLFNFFEAESVTTKNIGLEGALLAPTADLTHVDAVIYGQVIAGSFNGNGQIDMEPFNGVIPVSVPEPNANVLPAIMLFATIFMRRRKR